MRVIIEISPDDDDRIRFLVEQRRYRSSEQFIQTSIRNQLLLEDDQHLNATPAESRAPSSRSPNKATRPSDAPLPKLPQSLSMPNVTSGIDCGPAQLTPDEVIPSFVTKLWPLKAIVRFLANHTGRVPDGRIRDTEILVPLQSAMVETRQLLVEAHRQTPRVRGTALHTGLPEGGAKSIKRFHDLYFTGRPSAPGPNQSLSVRLGLLHVEVDTAGAVTIQLTAEGLEFATMKNPVLDSPSPADAEGPFTNKEATFLASQMCAASRRDTAIMQEFATWLRPEPQTRDDALAYMRRTLEENGGKTPALLNGMFVALTSRSVELGVASIVKDGTRTLYKAGARNGLMGDA